MTQPASPSRLFGHLSIRARLGLIQLTLLAALLVVSVVAWRASENERRAGHQLAVLSRAERNHIEATASHQALLADVEEALRTQTEVEEADALANAKSHARELDSYLASLRDPELPAVVTQRLQDSILASQQLSSSALALAEQSLRDRSGALALEPAFHAQTDALSRRHTDITLLLKAQVAAAERRTFTDASRSETAAVGICVLTALLAFGFIAFISKSVRQSLGEISKAARALAAGNLSARSAVDTPDEVGELSLSLNKMADDLQRMVDRMLADAHRDAFGAQVSRALEMAESESDVGGIATRAMPQVGDRLPTELLVAPSAQEHLTVVAVHPAAGSPGCPVESLSACTAIRRGAPTTFDTSEALDACPRLRGRPSGPMSATCVSVSFMGKTFGVLHATGPDRRPPTTLQQSQLATLGAQVGARIGTLRTFESTRAHAYTDPLTGLGNRRAMEQASAAVIREGCSFALAMADLDHFKRLNDLQGHEAGDQALKVFADVVTKSIRQADRAARWGGEGFAILFPDSNAAQALDIIERLRLRLEQALGDAGRTPFTASFGVADSSMGSSFEEVLRVADEALYAAKESGRNRAILATNAAAHGVPSPAACTVLHVLERGGPA